MTTDQTNQLTEFLLSTLKETKQFVVDQAPDVVRQMPAYATWDAKLGIYIGIGCVVAAILFFFLSISDDSYPGGRAIICGILSTILIIVGPFAICCNYSMLKKIEIAPKVFIMDQLRGNK